MLNGFAELSMQTANELQSFLCLHIAEQCKSTHLLLSIAVIFTLSRSVFHVFLNIIYEGG